MDGVGGGNGKNTVEWKKLRDLNERENWGTQVSSQKRGN